MSRWFCKFEGATSGPFTRDELEYLYDRGRLTAATEIRGEAERAWSRADSELKELFPQATVLVAEPPVAVAAVSTQPEARAVVAPPKPGPPPLPTEESEAERRRKQMLMGGGVGIATAAIIFLLLWLLLTWGGGAGFGGGLAGGGGHGTGQGSGDGSGSGAGSGSGRGGGSGSGTGGGAGTASSAASNSAKSAGGNQSGGNAGQSTTGTSGAAGDGAGTDDTTAQDMTLDPSAPPRSAFQRFKPPVQTTQSGGSAGSGDGGFLSGGGGGSDGSDFFGTRARGSKFIYIIDCSSSMGGDKFAKAKEELIASLKRLKPQHSAYVYFFSSSSYPMFSPAVAEQKLLKCTKENVKKMEDWINQFPCGGGTDPRQSVLDSLDLKSDAIFFLTDGGFDPSVADDVRNKNQKKTCINTICFVDAYGEPVMKQIASENRGDYRFVP